MAVRPVFISKNTFPFFREEMTSFVWCGGFAVQQKQKCVRSLHDSFRSEHPGMKVLEASTKSAEAVGVQLSAFNLPMMVSGVETVLECAFQGGKVFEHGGPYTDLLYSKPWEVKRDSRLKGSGTIIGFRMGNEEFPTEPKDFFYNWLYLKALTSRPELMEKAFGYDAFTDIEFNPQKSLNCQARSLAICKGLNDAGLLEDCRCSKETFLQMVYHADLSKMEIYTQMTLDFL